MNTTEENTGLSSSAGNRMYIIQDIAGKSKGLIATQRIPMGTRILSEKPVIRALEATAPDSPALRASICKQVDALTPEKRQAFLSMHMLPMYHTPANVPASQYLAIFRTNALPFGDVEEEAGIFFDACRINHACDNNSQKSWNGKLERHTVHALRDIEPGQEITITYLGVVSNRKVRQEALQKKFSFTCSCRLCSLPPDQSQESDRRLDKILRLDGLIGRNGLMGIFLDPVRILRYIDQQVHLYNEQGPNDVGLPRAFNDAAQVTLAHGDQARARIFAERAAHGSIISGGDDSINALNYKALSQDPSKHELYGMSMRWRTNVGDAPVGLDPKRFEDWLWSR